MRSKPGKLSLKRITLLLCGLLTISLTACFDDYETPTPRPLTYLAVYHGSPDAPDFDIYVDNNRINSQPFKFTHYSDYFNFVSPGTHRFKFTPVNAANAFIDTAITLTEDKVYSLFVVDQLQDMELLVVEDSMIAAGTGESALRLLQLSPDAPAVDVVSVKNNSSTPLFTNMDFRESTPFRKVASGSQNIQLRRAGTPEVLLTVPNVMLEPGRNYSFIVRGLVTPPAGNYNVLSLQLIRNY